MKGDRVQIISSLMFDTKDEVLPVYRPVLNESGVPRRFHDDTVEISSVGGVKSGSTGTVQGDPMKVHRSQLLHLAEQKTSLGGTNDFFYVVPVYLDAYQQIGWFPTDHVRVVSGGHLG